MQRAGINAEINARRRRGSIYVLVLGVSTLALSRIQTRISGAQLPAAKARFAAQSLIEVALLRIANDPDWRSTYVHEVWTDEETVGDALGAYKLVDELDGDLANGPTDPVRLYAKATVGEAVRLCSVELTPAETPNLLANPGFEDGTTDWSSTDCTLLSSLGPRTGRGCIFLRDRTSKISGAGQSVMGAIENGKSYYVEAWVKVAQVGGDEKIAITFRINGSASGLRTFVTASTLVGDSWTKIAGTLTPTWTGLLTEARWRISSDPDGGSEDFFVDDAEMVLSEVTMIPVPDSWRDEVLP